MAFGLCDWLLAFGKAKASWKAQPKGPLDLHITVSQHILIICKSLSGPLDVHPRVQTLLLVFYCIEQI